MQACQPALGVEEAHGENILSSITWHVQNKEDQPSQHGFKKDRYCLTSQSSFYDKVTHLADEEKAVDVHTWASVEPLTPFPTYSPEETGCS